MTHTVDTDIRYTTLLDSPLYVFGELADSDFFEDAV